MTYSNVRFFDNFKPNQISSITHFNNWRLSPIPSPSQLPPTHKVPVAFLLCRYGADSVLYGSSAGPYRLIYQKAKNYYIKLTLIKDIKYVILYYMLCTNNHYHMTSRLGVK